VPPALERSLGRYVVIPVSMKAAAKPAAGVVKETPLPAANRFAQEMGETGQRAQGGGCAGQCNGLQARLPVWFGPLLRIAHMGPASTGGSDKCVHAFVIGMPCLRSEISCEEGRPLPGILALDLHKDSIYGYAERPGEKARRFRCPNGRAFWEDLARRWVDKETSVVFEATGCAFALYDTLLPLAKEGIVANPLELKR